jgi:hypothetical protein
MDEYSPNALKRLGDSLQDCPDSTRWTIEEREGTTLSNVYDSKDNTVWIRTNKRIRLSPPKVLSRWLDLNENSERESYWQAVKKRFPASALPIILLQYIRRSSIPGVCKEFCFELKYILITS